MIASRLFAASLILLLMSLAEADEAADPAVERERQALRQLIPIYEQAANEGKPELLRAHLDPEFSGIMVTNDTVVGLAKLESYWADMRKMLGDGGTYSVKVQLDGHATLVGDTAVAHGTTADAVVMNGKTYCFTGHWTAVMRKRDGQWKILRIHASMPPISNPFVGAALSATKWIWGIGGGVAGLLAGWLARTLLRRRTPSTS